MDLSILFQRFAEQSPLIVLCGLIIWQLLKMYKEEKNLLRTERQERSQEIKEINLKHTEELKALNTYIRERDTETLESLSSVVQAVENINLLIQTKLN
jgi:hypothetical protein